MGLRGDAATRFVGSLKPAFGPRSSCVSWRIFLSTTLLLSGTGCDAGLLAYFLSRKDCRPHSCFFEPVVRKRLRSRAEVPAVGSAQRHGRPATTGLLSSCDS